MTSAGDDTALFAAWQRINKEEEASLLARELRENIYGCMGYVHSPVVRVDAEERLDGLDEERKSSSARSNKRFCFMQRLCST